MGMGCDCINYPENSPPTCCCGCSLTCGIITVGVFQAINLAINIFALNTWGVIGAFILLLPIILLAFWRESKALRFANFLIQAIGLGCLIISLIVWLVCIDGYDLPELFCNVTTHGVALDLGEQSCMQAVRLYLYIAWAFALIIVLPIQFLIMNIFKAYHNELKEEGQGYSQLPNEDEANNA